MDVSSPFSTEAAKATPVDPRLQPTPDYGTLGPGSDIPGPEDRDALAASRKPTLHSAHLIAAVIGMAAALIVGMTKAHPIWHAGGAVQQILLRVDRWNGQVQWNSQIASLTTAALNSNDMRVRESGVEVE